MPQSYIVFQAYGNEYILQECLFALLTLSKQHANGELKDTQVCIYTDQPEWFRQVKGCPLQLHFRTVDAAQLKAWRGEIDFVHRVKIEVLRDMARTHTGSILYLDTDVCFLAPLTTVLQNINDGHLYMHVQESVVKDDINPIFTKLHKFLRTHNPLQVGNETIQISTEAAMWNAGVLGFHTRYAPLLDKVLHFTDEVYKQFPKHVVEQFAFSWYFQQETPLKSTVREVFHYWHFKEMRAYLASFFAYFKNAGWNELEKYTELLQWHAPMQDKCSFYQNRNGLEKMRRIYWQPRLPDWSQLLQQMF
jgi:hypothetical protein